MKYGDGTKQCTAKIYLGSLSPAPPQTFGVHLQMSLLLSKKKKSKQSWGSFIHLLCQIYSHKINYSAWFRPNTCQSQICVLKSKDNVKNADVLFCLFFWLLLSKTIHNSLEMVSGTWQVSVQDQDTRFLLQVWNNLKLGTHDKHELVREHGVSLFKISLEYFG